MSNLDESLAEVVVALDHELGPVEVGCALIHLAVETQHCRVGLDDALSRLQITVRHPVGIADDPHVTSVNDGLTVQPIHHVLPHLPKEELVVLLVEALEHRCGDGEPVDATELVDDLVDQVANGRVVDREHLVIPADAEVTHQVVRTDPEALDLITVLFQDLAKRGPEAVHEHQV